MFSIIISGAFRNFAETWPENKKFFDQTGEPYLVFVHTWRENYGTPRKVYKDRNWKGFSFDFLPRKYKNETFEVNEELVKSVIPEATVIIEDFYPDLVVEQYKLPPKSQTDLHQNFLNSVAMYQGISRSFKLALQEAELNSCTKFVRLRTDYVIDGSVNVLGFDKDIYFAGPGVDPGFGYVSDQFFICSKPVAEIVSQCESSLLSYVTNEGWDESTRTPFYGERILSYVLKDCLKFGLVQSAPVIGKIKRPNITKDDDIRIFGYLLVLISHNLRVLLKHLFKFVVNLRERIKL